MNRFVPVASGWLLLCPLVAGAQDASPPRSLEHSANLDALPGIHRVGIASLSAPRVYGATSLGYGYTEPQNAAPSAHHRLMGSLAVGGTLWPFLGVALRTDLQHDRHGPDELGPDEGTLLGTAGMLRLGTAVTPGVHVGAESRVVFPGGARTSQGLSPIFEGRALLSYERLPGWVLAFSGGYRTASSGLVLEEAVQMRPGDRVALGLSEFDAILMGVGAITHLSRAEVFGEVTWDLLVGTGAPTATRSPLLAAFGMRLPLNDWLKLQGVAEVSPLDRAPSTPGDPLVPIEPRVAFHLGALARWGTPRPPPETQSGLPRAMKAQKPQETPAEEPAALRNSTLRVILVDQKGHPISDALVTALAQSSSGEAPETWVLPLKELNVYELSELPEGEVELVVRADLLKEHSQVVVLSGAEAHEENVTLLPAEAIGSQLRGVVRSYSGSGIAGAQVTVDPGSGTVRCNAAGEFEMDLSPGTYQVRIEAEGYRSQTRKLTVREEGVTVLNADLKSAP